MTMRIASRVADVAPFRVMELFRRAGELAAQGRDIIHLEVGEPDFPTPPPILAAARRYLDAGDVKYTNAAGITPLREAIAAHYARAFGVAVEPERIFVTAGASGALLLALAMLVEPGSSWLLPDPGYPCNRHFVRTFEGNVTPLPVDAATSFQPTAAAVANAWASQTAGIVLASPANPTGTEIPAAILREIVNAVRARDGTVIVDEIYQGLVFDNPAGTALALGNDLFVINSFSKYFGMTGWRLGWLVVPTAYQAAAEKMAQNLFICASAVAQHAALAAFAPGTIELLEARRVEFARRRDLLVGGLLEQGFSIPARPTGAFYVYADISPSGIDAAQWTHSLLEDWGIAATPGNDFGVNRSDDFVRFAYTTSIDRIADALERIVKAKKTRGL